MTAEHGRSHPEAHREPWSKLNARYEAIVTKYPKPNHPEPINHLGTPGTRNHIIEVCLDELRRMRKTSR